MNGDPFALYIQKTAKNKGKMDKHLLRKGKRVLVAKLMRGDYKM